jgi:hypothetical protein
MSESTTSNSEREQFNSFLSEHPISPLTKPSQLVGSHDVLMITLDALRYDVAQEALAAGLTPNFADLLQGRPWELRQTPGNFTYSAHHAFFAGFLPTPSGPGPHPRLFAAKFAGSVTTDDDTLVFDAPDIVTGFSELGYHTVCIGGVGFFNKLNPLGNALPSMFAESHWNESLGVTDPNSTENQFNLAIEIADKLPADKRLFMFVNVSALHQPNCIFAPGANNDSKETQAQALAYVDRHVPNLLFQLRQRAPLMVFIFSDHGTAYGEDGYTGHRVNHENVLNVPYLDFVI